MPLTYAYKPLVIVGLYTFKTKYKSRYRPPLTFLVLNLSYYDVLKLNYQ